MYKWSSKYCERETLCFVLQNVFVLQVAIVDVEFGFFF